MSYLYLSLRKFRNCISLAFLTLLMPLTGSAQESAALPTLRLTYDAAELNYDYYINGTMSLTDTDGTVTELNALFKTRGATARQYPMKPALNMKLVDDKGKELDYNLLGLREASSFILDAMAIDRINMRNRVCFEIWNSFSRLPYETDFGSRNGTVGKFVEVWINDSYKGIYDLTDKINRKLLGLKKPKTNDDDSLKEVRGVLYKNGTNDIEDQNTPGFFNDYMIYVPLWHDAWELHEPDDYPCPEVWQPLVDYYSDNNFTNVAYIKDHFYLQNLADYTIHLMALAIMDNWGTKNRYFSIVNIQDETRFVVTPWDLDTSLGGEFDGSLFDGVYSEWPLDEVVKNAPLPFSTVIGRPEFTAMLADTWRNARNDAFAVDSVSARLDKYCKLFVESGAWQRTVDKWKYVEYSEMYVDDLPKEISLIKDWYAKRHAEMDAYFGTADDDAVSDITVDSETTMQGIFNLQGVRLNNADSPGLYIIDGKKVYIK